jgi:MFS family permease
LRLRGRWTRLLPSSLSRSFLAPSLLSPVRRRAPFGAAPSPPHSFLALPAPALWARLGRRWARPTLLLAALLIQAGGIALPALVPGVGPALVSAVLFGGTFLGIASLALVLGAHPQYPRAVAVLTTGYSTGQILGPLLVTPLLHGGYRIALLVGAAVVLAAAAAAAVLRIDFPHRVGGMVEPSRAPNRARV